jgi:hypothetical protein
MMSIIKPLLFVLFSLISIGCENSSNYDLELLAEWMTGSFNSEEQSKADTNFYNIHLNMVPIWEQSEETKWLYVEQAASWALERPYRQRVYRLTALDGNKFESAVFTIPDPLRFAGDWKKDDPLTILSPDSLTQKNGCSIILVKEGDAFVGSTVDKN